MSFHVNPAGVLEGDATEWVEWAGKGRQAIDIGLWNCADGWRYSVHLRFPQGGFSVGAIMRDAPAASRDEALGRAIVETRDWLNGYQRHEQHDVAAPLAWLEGLITDPTQADLFAGGPT